MNDDPALPAYWTIDLLLEDESWRVLCPPVEALVHEVARVVGLDTHVTSQVKAGSSVAISLADDERVRGLNKQYRGKDAPTNVLSFPNEDDFDMPGEVPHLGDIVLARGVVEREAREQGKSIENHIAHLVTHGLLHLVGYDHIDDVDAEEMENLEADILAHMGVPNPYAMSSVDEKEHAR